MSYKATLELGKGIGNLWFGMDCKKVEEILGKPDRKYKDEDQNEIFIYNDKRLALTFYEDEGFRFGYLVSADPELVLNQLSLVGRKASEVMAELPKKQFVSWESEWLDSQESHFNEDQWVMLIEEFGRIIKVEMGAPIVKDEFVWAYKG